MLPSTAIESSCAPWPVYGTVVLGGALVVLDAVAAGGLGERLEVEGPLHAELDVLGGDGGAVLVLHAVADGERPLGEVVVGGAEVGGQVGHEDRLAGLLVVDELGQRPVEQRGRDRVGVGVVDLARVHGLERRERDDLDDAALLGALDLDRALPVRVGEVAGVGEVGRHLRRLTSAVRVAVVGGVSAAGAQRERPRSRQGHQGPGRPSHGAATFPSCVWARSVERRGVPERRFGAGRIQELPGHAGGP